MMKTAAPRLLLAIFVIVFSLSGVGYLRGAEKTSSSGSKYSSPASQAMSLRRGNSSRGRAGRAIKAAEKASFKPKTSRRTSNSSGKSSSKSSGSLYQPLVNRDAVVIYLSPLDSTVRENDVFETSVIIYNPRSRFFDSMYFVLKYDPEILTPIGLSDFSLAPFLEQPSTKLFYRETGTLIYSAQLLRAINPQTKRVVSVQWETRVSTPFTKISFGSHEKQYSKLTWKDKDVLGSKYLTRDGFISAGIVVEPKKDDASTVSFYDNIYDNRIPILSTENIEGATVSLVGPGRPVKVNDVFDVHISLNNPEHSPIDSVNLVILFDPSALEVIDHDEDNWITRGINIHDGPHHNRFPFDFHIKNDANNRKGEIVYRNGLSFVAKLHSGTLATIRFKALKASRRVPVLFKPKEKSYEMATSVTFLGSDALGDPLSMTDGMESLFLRILQE